MTLQPSVCIDAVLNRMPLERALETVAQAGYSAFEFWAWWEKDLDVLKRQRDRLQLQIAACCTKFHSLVDPQTQAAYLAGLQESIAIAQQLDCPVLISQVGDLRAGVPRQEQRKQLVQGLRAAAEFLAGSSITLAIEPLNELVDHPGYYLVHSEEAFEVIDEVGCEQIKVTFDIYHQQISEGNLISNILEHWDRIAHFHAAGVPGRHELQPCELDYSQIFDAIRRTGFSGYVGLEYWPQHDALLGLQRAKELF